jgi:hypothetical protein
MPPAGIWRLSIPPGAVVTGGANADRSLTRRMPLLTTAGPVKVLLVAVSAKMPAPSFTTPPSGTAPSPASCNRGEATV